jgi:hypothetical protein
MSQARGTKERHVGHLEKELNAEHIPIKRDRSFDLVDVDGNLPDLAEAKTWEVSVIPSPYVLALLLEWH